MIVGMIVRTAPQGVEVRVVVRWLPPDERRAALITLAKVLAVTLLSLVALLVAPHALPLLTPFFHVVAGA